MQRNAFTDLGLLQRGALLGGPLAALGLMLFADLAPGNPLVTRTAAVAVWMGVWWISGAAPMGATALLPLVLFPLLGIMDAEDAAGYFINDAIFLFLGGFLIALGMERWNLHRRIALALLLRFGVKPRRLLAGFMLPTFFLSMWISNTATTMMMAPIALSLLAQLEQDMDHPGLRRYAVGLLCGIAYSSSIGGTATLIGTVPNLVFVNTYSELFPEAPQVSFAQWFVYGTPLAVAVGLTLWAMLSLFYCPRGGDFGMDASGIRAQYQALGPMKYEEKVIAVFFSAAALLWLTRTGADFGDFALPGWADLFENPKYFRDGTVAIFVALGLFLIPSRNEAGKYLMDWEVARRLPWEILLLIGGGFALAGAFSTSGLSLWVGGFFEESRGLPPFLVVLILCAVVSVLTEFTSNTATCQILLPILASVAISLSIHPLFLMLPATLACSYAFMLPVATPPNAIVFGTGRIRVAEMVRAGFVFNFMAVFLLTVTMFTLGAWVFGIDPGSMPAWATLPGGK